MKNIELPKEGIKGLKAHFKSDIVSGFLVFLLALPLSLGIAKASGFPPAMGVLTAIIGGLFVSLFKVSPLSIKGPAAGLITVCSGAIMEMGGGETGWHLVCAAIVVVGIIQIIFGYLKLGSLSDFFPHSAVHGMLAAIGLIIIAKQIPVLLGDQPDIYNGLSPLSLYAHIPSFIASENVQVAIVGFISILIMFLMPLIKINFIKKIPAPMIVLLVAIPISIALNFKNTQPNYILVTIGSFWKNISFNANFSGIGSLVFWKYVLIFLFVNSLESLLTVKAIDNLDPYKRKSDYNGDLKALGAGNALAGFLGGLPMISEVVRSSANVNYNAKTKWSNFFHGLFLLIAMISMIPLIELIPNAALAAMLVYAGFKLASPKTFFSTWKAGKGQFIIFIVTIITTLITDLLIGIAAGILVKFVIHLINGAKLNHLFKADYELEKKEKSILIKVNSPALFSNLLGFKKLINQFEDIESITIDFSNSTLIDHSFMEFLYTTKIDFEYKGVSFQIEGLDNHNPLSKNHLSARKLKKQTKK